MLSNAETQSPKTQCQQQSSDLVKQHKDSGSNDQQEVLLETMVTFGSAGGSKKGWAYGRRIRDLQDWMAWNERMHS